MQSLEACWTSGGGDLTAGSVDRSVLVVSQVMGDLLRQAGGDQLAVLERVTTQGDRLCQEVAVPVYDVGLYLGVFAVDSAGNRGAMSNIVRVLVPSPPLIKTDNQVSHLIIMSAVRLYVLQYKSINNLRRGSVCLLKITEK